jgi:cytosine/adenosine deaminase-related metal-dependent hydrolase
MATTLIRDLAWAVVWDPAAGTHRYARNVDILMQAGRIARIVPHDPAAPPPDGAAVMDGRALMAMPGLVDLHSHPTTEPAYRGVREDHGVPEHQMTGLYERLIAFKLDAPGRAAGMRLAYAELLSAGVTSVVDLSAPFTEWLDIMRASGLRVWAGPGFASARWGMTAPRNVTWTWDATMGRAGLDQAVGWMKRAEQDPSGRLTGIVFPAQIDTVEEDLLREAIALAEESNRPFTTHIAQSVVEVREMVRRHGITPIQWAAQLGLLTPRSILGHAIFLDEHPSVRWHGARDLGLIADSGATVAHCPSPFARYGEHLDNFGRYRARGVRMAIGTDCAPHNPIEEMRLAILLARNATNDIATADTATVFHAATAAGADALGRPDLGRLAEGAAADVVLVALDHPLMVPARDPLRSLVFHAADRAVRHVFVGGDCVLSEGRPVGLDLTEAMGVLAESQERMLRDAPDHDWLKRAGDAIAPLTLAVH